MNIKLLWNRFLKPWTSQRDLEWTITRLERDVHTTKEAIWDVKEVSGDAYKRSREKETVSEFSVRRLNQLEEEVRSLREELKS